MRRRGRLWDALALASLSALALSTRWNAFALPHHRGDQLIWAGLARNVSARGAFNVRRIDLGTQELDPSNERSPARDLAYLRFRVPSSDEKGSLLQGLIDAGEGYWDRPLANQPPLFTVLLVLSHAVLGSAGDEFPVLATSPRAVQEARARGDDMAEWEIRLAREAAASPPPGAARTQLWATLPPVLSDVATTALIYIVGVSLLGSRRAAIVAAAIFALDPLALFCSHRLLSNSTLATLSLASIAAWTRAELRETERTRFLAVSGALAGAAILVKVSAIFLLPAAAMACLATRTRKLEPGVRAYFLLALLVASPWLLLQWKVLGNPLNLTYLQQSKWPLGSPFGMLVTGRGHGYYVSRLVCSPLVLAGIAGAVAWIVAFLARREQENARARAVAGAFALLVLAAAELHPGGKEARHILHVYPVLALGAGSFVVPLLEKGRSLGLGSFAPRALVALAVGLVLWSQIGTGVAWVYDLPHPP